MRKFRRLVRVDCADLYFTPLIVLDNISDEVGCHKNVQAFITYMDQEVWPKYSEFHTKTILNTRRLCRSEGRRKKGAEARGRGGGGEVE